MSQSNFTTEQQKAIEFYPTPLSTNKINHLVIEAGAGSGKTTVLKERVKFLIEQKNHLPHEIILITFTKDATQELKHRVENLSLQNKYLQDALKLIHVSTIDSLFISLTESIYPKWWDDRNTPQNDNDDTSDSHNTIINPTLTHIDEGQALQKIEESFYQFFIEQDEEFLKISADFILSGGLGIKTFFAAKETTFNSILKMCLNELFISSTPDHLRVSSSYIHKIVYPFIEKLHQLARHCYLNRLINGTLTFQDRTVFLKEHAHLLNSYSFKELIVDEYQDTNYLQHEVLLNFAEKNNARLTVVGDPKQSIYAFRGAHVDVFQNLTKDPTWKHIELKINFRSNPKLLQQLNTLAELSFSWENPETPIGFFHTSFAKEALKKRVKNSPLQAGRVSNIEGKDPCITLFLASFPKDAQKIKKEQKIYLNDYLLYCFGYHLKNKVESGQWAHWKDIVFLCETNAQITKCKKIFDMLSIPLSCEIETQTKESPFTDEVLVALLRIILNIETSLDHFYVLMSPLCQTSAENVFNLLSIKEKKHLKIVPEFILQIKKLWANSPVTHFALKFKNLVTTLCQTPSESQVQYEATQHFSKQSEDFFRWLYELVGQSYFLTIVNNTNDQKNIYFIQKTIQTFLDRKQKNIEVSATQNALTLKTVHKSKGLEWDIVCFYPSQKRKSASHLFCTATSWPYIDFNWLNEDMNKLAFLKNIKNPFFTETDFEVINEKTQWFSDIRKEWENGFERERIFYTAFTRAKKELIFLQPESHHNSLSAPIYEKKQKNDPVFHKNFERHVFLQYFNLTKNSENVICLENKGEDLQSFITLKKNKKIYQTENNLTAIPGKENNESQTCFDLKTLTEQHVNLTSVSSQLKTEQDHTQSKDILSTIQFKQKLRSLSKHGLELHAAQENFIIPFLIQTHGKRERAPCTLAQTAYTSDEQRSMSLNQEGDTSIHKILTEHALNTWTELEIWEKEQNKSHFSSKRNMIDSLYLFETKKFLELHAKQNWLNLFVNQKNHSFNDYKYILLIADLKTGRQNSAHQEQVKHYLDLVRKIDFSFWFYKLKEHPNDSIFVMASVVYLQTQAKKNQIIFTY